MYKFYNSVPLILSIAMSVYVLVCSHLTRWPLFGGQNNKYVFFHRICLKVEEKTGKNWASSNIYTFCKGGQVPKINDVLVRRFDH